MKTSKLGWLVVLMTATMLPACGGDDDDDSTSAAPAGLVEACNKYCDAQATANCGLYTSAAECKSSECGGLSKVNADCGTAAKASYDCLNGLSDVCTQDSCQASGSAMISKCM